MSDFKINFIVFSPQPYYIDYIGGVMVNHSLANQLAELGENSYIYANTTKEGYNSTVIPWGTHVDYDPRNTILITVAGDGEATFENYIPEDLKSIPNKVRWLVNDQLKYYPEEEKFYKYCDYFKILKNQRVDGEFASLDIDFDTFTNKNLPRSGGCFYTKGQVPKIRHHSSQDLSLDSIYSLPQDQRNLYLAEVFNTKEYFLCYSHRSFTAALAALCGCTVIVIPHDDTPRDYWSENFPSFKYGIAYGIDDVQWAIDTKHLVRKNLENIQAQGIENVKSFVNDCYEWLKIK
jgi:hypothetical protein